MDRERAFEFFVSPQARPLNIGMTIAIIDPITTKGQSAIIDFRIALPLSKYDLNYD